MWINRLIIKDFRCHPDIRMEVGSAPWVVLEGGNGAGKTSLMEAVYTTARGRSFRANATSKLIRTGCAEASILLESGGERQHHLGVALRAQDKSMRLDGAEVGSLAELGTALPVDYLGGAGHRLLDGAPAARRRFLDWCLFHVEPSFLEVWRAWSRAHRQRNEWLRRGDYPASMGWTAAVAEYGERLTGLRESLSEKLSAWLQATPWMKLGGKTPRLLFKPGWGADSLCAALQESAARERRAGRAIVGPQYDDWTLDLDGTQADQLSRGQAKLASFFLWHAQARTLQEAGRAAILLADDFQADLDERSLGLALAALEGVAGQVWLTAGEGRAAMVWPDGALRFHVEPGRIRAD